MRVMTRSKSAWLVLALLVPASSVRSHPGEPPAKSRPAPEMPRERELPSEDTSLSLDAYIAAGMPAYNRTWTSSDMQKAYKVLKAVAKDKRRLPRYGSDRSGKLFDRMTSEQNLASFEDPSVPLFQRFPTYLQFIEALRDIGDLYASVFVTDSAYVPEIAEFTGFNQRTVRAGLKLIDEQVKSFDKSDPLYAKRMEGLELIKRGMATMAAGCLQTLEELPSQQSQARKRLVGHLKASLPEIMPRLPPASRQEILVRIQELATRPSMNDVKADLEDLDKRVRKTASKDNDLRR
jgi:hypothetical protein